MTQSKHVMGIQWYSTDDSGGTIVDQLYQQNADLMKEIEEIRLIFRKPRAS